MYHIKLDRYVPEPHPVSGDRIVAAHYYGAWKKGAAGLHNGFDDLHGYPERTPLMGYYDEENPEVCDWEIKWASEHGINCFIHCWYRKRENMGKPVTVDDLRCGHAIHEALFHAKYQNRIKFAIMFENSPSWGTTDADDMVDHLMPFWTEQYFKRDNYLCIDNKPVLFVYYQKRLNGVFPDPAVQKQTFDRCREYAKMCGFDGMIFAVQEYKLDKIRFDAYLSRGYDFIFSYSTGYEPTGDFPDEQDVIDGQCDRLKEYLALDPMHAIATASCFRDATPRTTPHWVQMGYHYADERKFRLSPEHFRTVLKRMKAQTDALPDGAWGKRIFMIDNWNEWDEGHYVAPSHEFGFKYLQAIREELSERDNLPDYRTPQDLGFDGYNTAWQIPDFAPLCAERLKKEETE